MEEWYSMVRTMMDESENAYLTKMFTYDVFQQLKRAKVKDKGKFKNRMGPEFESWVASLLEEYPKPLVETILNDDEFWVSTLSLTLGV